MAFSKILEKIATVQLVEYFVNDGLFTSCQYGYRKGVNTDDAALSIVNSSCDAFDEGHNVVGVFLDLSNSKAFDSLKRNILFRKLEYYGIRSVELEWFKSYFDDRKQIVCYKGVRSKPMRTNFGVGQSSICGPISFCIFMNDLCRCSILSFVMYADDTCVYNVGSDVNENMRMMNIELQRVSERMRSNCLTLNYKKKCYYIVFKRKQRLLLIFLLVILNLKN